MYINTNIRVCLLFLHATIQLAMFIGMCIYGHRLDVEHTERGHKPLEVILSLAASMHDQYI